MGKLKEILDNHYSIIITGAVVFLLGVGWVASENIRVNPIQKDLEKKTEEVEENEAKIKQYKSKIKQYESKIKLDDLVVYDKDVWHKEGEVFAVLGGQVSINFAAGTHSENARFNVDVVGEKDVQGIKAEPGKRAVFRYDGNLYLINVKEFEYGDWEGSRIKVSVSKVEN